MSLQGYLAGDRSLHDSGKAATMTVGSTRDRNTLFTHLFPGAHAIGQVAGALSIGIVLDRATATPGEEVAVRLEVANLRAGHAFPSGSSDLRLAWLELTAETSGAVVALPAAPADGSSSFDVAGATLDDGRLLGEDVPPGSRLYRVVFLDQEQRPTVSSWDARAVAFDNRLRAEERREERYAFRVPEGADGRIVLRARIRYRRYPPALAAALGLRADTPVDAASVETTLAVAGD
jgi:hypothetical protein